MAEQVCVQERDASPTVENRRKRVNVGSEFRENSSKPAQDIYKQISKVIAQCPEIAILHPQTIWIRFEGGNMTQGLKDREASCISLQQVDDRKGANGEAQVHGRGANRFRFKKGVFPLEIMMMCCGVSCFSPRVEGLKRRRDVLSSRLDNETLLSFPGVP